MMTWQPNQSAPPDLETILRRGQERLGYREPTRLQRVLKSLGRLSAFDYVFFAIVAGCAVGVCIMIWGLVLALAADTFALRKDRWTCAASHRETHMTLVPVGKALIPQWWTGDVCDAYKRKPTTCDGKPCPEEGPLL